MPIMMYHGDCDITMPIGDAIEMLNSINKRGGDAQIKILYGQGHNIWNDIYSGDALYSWLLTHKRTKE